MERRIERQSCAVQGRDPSWGRSEGLGRDPRDRGCILPLASIPVPWGHPKKLGQNLASWKSFLLCAPVLPSSVLSWCFSKSLFHKVKAPHIPPPICYILI